MRDPAEIRRWFGWDYEGLEEEIEFIFFQASKADDDAHVIDGGPGGMIALEDAGRPDGRARHARGGRDGVYDEVNEGWLTFIQQLRFYLERHPGRTAAPQHVASGGEEWFRDREPARRRARGRLARDPHARARDRHEYD